MLSGISWYECVAGLLVFRMDLRLVDVDARQVETTAFQVDGFNGMALGGRWEGGSSLMFIYC